MASAPKTSTKQHQEEKRAKLWKQDPDEWRTFLEEYGVQRVKTGKPEHITFCCPFHDEEQPSAAIYVKKQFFSCFGGGCPSRFIQDPFEFVSRLCNLSYNDAAILFLQKFSATGALNKQDVQNFTAEALKYQRMQMLSEVFHMYLCNVWAEPTVEKYPETAVDAVNWLRGRGVTDVAPISSIGLFPLMKDMVALLNNIGSAEDVKWCVDYLGHYVNAPYANRIVFTYAKTNGAITAFKLRDFTRDHSATRIIHDKEEPLGFFGLSNASYTPLLGQRDFKDTFNKALIVEGEFDQIAIHQNQINSSMFDYIVLGLGGSGHGGLDELAKIGITKADLWGDDDIAGRAWPRNILEKTTQVACRIFNWPDEIKVPNVDIDPDEAIRTHGADRIYKALADDLNYAFPQDWCHKLVLQLLEGTAAEDIREQERVITDIAPLLKNESELRSFIEKVCESFPLLEPNTVIKEVRKHDETDAGFIGRAVEWIKTYLHVIYADRNQDKLVLWDKQRKEEVVLKMGRVSSVDVFSTTLPRVSNIEDRAGDLMAWAKTIIGFPAYYPSLDSIDPEGKVSQYGKIRSLVKENVRDALYQVMTSAPKKPIRRRGQGIHLKNIKNPDTPGYIVNGDRIYKLSWNDKGDRLTEVIELEGPSDKNFVFDLEPRDAFCHDESAYWLSCITKPKDFFARPNRNLRQCYDAICNIIDLGWAFQYQATDVQYIALLIFYTYILDSMQKKTMTHIKGEYASGKSSLLSLVSRGDQLPEYVLSYHATTLDNYTKAGIFQTFKDTRIMMGLDEANDDKKAMSTLREAVRGLAVKGFAVRNLGTQDQTGQTDYIYNAWITASATSIINDMDYSRCRTLNLIKDTSKPNIQLLLRRKFKIEHFEELRRDIFLNVIHIAPKIARYYHYDVPEEFAREGREHWLTREVDTLIPLAAIGKCIGIDYIQFMETFTSNREEEKQIRAVSEESPALFRTILNTKVSFRTPDGERDDKTIKYALGNPTYRSAINETDCGVYYDEQERCIGVSWDTALLNLLKNTKYNKRTPAYCLDVASRCSEYRDSEIAEKSGLAVRMKKFGMAAVENYSYFDVRKTIGAFEEVQDSGDKDFDNDATADNIEIKKDSNEEGTPSLPGMNM